MKNIQFDLLSIDPEIEKNEMTQRTIDSFPKAKKYFLNEYHVSSEKRHMLHLKKQKGQFLKPCPGTTNYLCCGYDVLNIGQNCLIGCSYCILQDYLQDKDTMTIFCNTDDLFQELDKKLETTRKPFLRIGTGEFTDSLLLDMITDYNEFLIPYFLHTKNAILEIKSKLDYIENLKQFRPKRNIIASWSINTPAIIKEEEGSAALLEKRLNAARICQDYGYLIGFHFDPMIFYRNWEKDYLRVIDRIFSVINYKDIVWISLGTFRFMPSFKNLMINKHPHSPLPYGEFIPGLDKKMRYVKPIRIEMYKKIIKHIKQYAPDVLIYFCMESGDVWQKTLGWAPSDNKEFSNIMNKRVLELRGY